MRSICLVASAALLAACAGTPETPPELEAVRDYVEVGELEETDRIRTHGSDQWSPLTNHYALYGARDGWYLMEFTRICRELTDNTRVTPDFRYDHNVLRSRFDTLRGCRIDRIYPLTEAQKQELEALVESYSGGN
jgi:hypothetical protein